MPTVLRSWLLVPVAVALIAIGGCSTDNKTEDNSSFGNDVSALNDIANVEYYSSDEALAAGKSFFRAQSYGNSTYAFRKAVELEPGDREAWLGLAASYDRLRRFDLADRAYDQFAHLTKPPYQYYNNRGYSYLLRGKLKKARRFFLKAYEMAPKNQTVANNIKLLGASTETIIR